MKTVILAEKPSVGRNIADALKCKIKKDGYLEGEEYIITWAFGHLLTLFDCKDYDEAMGKWDFNNFPYIPSPFRYKIKTVGGYNSKTDSGAKKQLAIIKSLIERNDVDRVITATDFDREGETIATIIFRFIGVKKPIYRLLINEWTPQEIKKGLSTLKEDDEMKNLQDAGISRQWLDWVVGINFTTVATLKYARGKGNVLNVGRVLMPTLKMIYDREKEIENFKTETYFELYATFSCEKGEYKGKFFYGNKEKFTNEESVKRLKEELSGKSGMVSEAKKELKKEYPQALFNMTNLQGFVTSKFKGWTSDKVLKVAQELYEKKLITYPRTSSTALEESIIDKAKDVLEVHKRLLPFKDEVVFSVTKKVFNNDKVESHSAIIPTYILPKSLSKDEEVVYTSIRDRFISQFMEPAEFEITEIITKVMGDNHERLFKTKGKVMKKEGWMKLNKSGDKESKKKKSDDDQLLPPMVIDDEVDVKNLKVDKKQTKPPAHHTERTILKAMETCGKNRGDADKDDESEEEVTLEVLKGYSIGTAATRAEIIKKLKDTKYIKISGKSLLITDKGKNIIETFPIKELLDTDYTGRMEKALYDIEQGSLEKDRFLSYIFKFTKDGVEKMKRDRMKIVSDTREPKESKETQGTEEKQGLKKPKEPKKANKVAEEN